MNRFIRELEPNEVFVFGSNLAGFHGAGPAGFAMRGTTKNDWRSDPSFLKIARRQDPDPRGRWAVFGVGRGYQVGLLGRSYAIPTVERPGVQGCVTVPFLYQELLTLVRFARAHPELRFLVVKLGATRSEGGYSYIGASVVRALWARINRRHGLPSNIILLD